MSVDLRACPDAHRASTACLGGDGASACGPGTTGPLCRTCTSARAYFDKERSACVDCAARDARSESGTAAALVAVVLLVGSVALLLG